MSSLKLQDVRKNFGTQTVIHGIDLDVEEGEFIVFVGPSGCGKSTMLRIISGLDQVTSGRIFIAGNDVTFTHPSKRQVAMVFQSYALFPHMTVAQNIGFGLRLAKLPKAEIAKRVFAAAEVLQIEDLLGRYPRQLSGGQRQRVAIGRAIIRNPRVFLFDEPLSNLDAALRVQMRLEIARLHNRLGATIVYVTHDQTEAMTLADRIVVIKEGEIAQVGNPLEVYESPANKFVAGFIGAPSMNFLKASIRAEGGRSSIQLYGAALAYLPDRFAREYIELGIRPEHLSFSESSDCDFWGVVELVEELGSESFAYLQTEFNPEPVTIRLEPNKKVKAGDKLPVSIDRNAMHVFSESGSTVAIGRI
ncbi:MAG: sn-glycerol-3-phosphate ABC transporter ATP-binding protein UgpC [Albidovulum sp.]|nr:sn-glycerol-3-phosphate ABC transporter ATP-binding protein UgpC [Albidovulum sp.]